MVMMMMMMMMRMMVKNEVVGGDRRYLQTKLTMAPLVQGLSQMSPPRCY